MQQQAYQILVGTEPNVHCAGWVEFAVTVEKFYAQFEGKIYLLDPICTLAL